MGAGRERPETMCSLTKETPLYGIWKEITGVDIAIDSSCTNPKASPIEVTDIAFDGIACMSLHHTDSLENAKLKFLNSYAIQGNLDPASLIPENSLFLDDHVLSILDIMKDKKFIFNVGHGITPDCKIDNVKKVVNIVNGYNRDY